MLWHHYAGLVFGFLSCTWAFSGALSLGPFQSLRGTPITQTQRRALSGGPVKLELVTIERMQASVAAFKGAFTPKELELLQFRGKPYFIGYRPPPEYDFSYEVGSNAERYEPAREHRLVSVQFPEQGAFTRFDDEVMLKIAREAMPQTTMQDAVFLSAYDSYYYNQDGLRSLPVLRVRYADPDETWLYLDPQHGTMSKQDRKSRLNRWLYHGFHSLDFPFLYYKRPLWDIVVIVFSAGGILLSVTTLLPSWRRLMRHLRRLQKLVLVLMSPKRKTEVPASGD
jgi:hypothetical protein